MKKCSAPYQIGKLSPICLVFGLILIRGISAIHWCRNRKGKTTVENKTVFISCGRTGLTRVNLTEQILVEWNRGLLRQQSFTRVVSPTRETGNIGQIRSTRFRFDKGHLFSYTSVYYHGVRPARAACDFYRGYRARTDAAF